MSVDTPVLGLRLSEMRQEWNIPEGMTHPNIVVSEEFKANNPESEAMMFGNILSAIVRSIQVTNEAEIQLSTGHRPSRG